MTATENLRMRAYAIADEIEQRLIKIGGDVTGTTSDIRKYLGISNPNNELREAITVLYDRGSVVPAPLNPSDEEQKGIHTTYRFIATAYPRIRLLEATEKEELTFCGTALMYLEYLQLQAFMDAEAFDTLILELKAEGKIKAPLVATLSESRPQSANTYLFLELKIHELVH